MQEQQELTTEQLAEKAVKDVQQMSPQEKAELRKHLDQQFKQPS
jgi:hypothetical protein